MKKKLIILAVLAAVAALAYHLTAGNYNSLVKLEEDVNAQWSQVQNLYQERYDKIPNLVSTVKGYAKHEESVLAEVTEARAKAGGIVEIDSSILDDEKKLAEFQKIQDSLSSSLQRLLAVTENYPELKASENFLALQAEISESENKITLERRRFNEKARAYNTAVRTFPKNIAASLGGFKAKAYFESVQGSESAPKVEF